MHCVPLDYDLWNEFDFYELTESMRQKEDKSFFEMLNRIRIGNPSETDINNLKDRQLKIVDQNNKMNEITSAFLRELKINKKTVCLLSKTKDVDKFNSLISKALNIDAVEIFADDCKYNKRLNRMDNKTKNKNNKSSSNDTAGLESFLKLGIGSRIMLRRNINMEKGLVNGALGYVVKIIKNEFNYVNAIDVLFDHHNHPTRIERYSAQFEIEKNVYITRQQFPINLACAFTIHKSQGLSLDTIFLDIGEDIFESGMSYVALSRARKLSNITLIDFRPEKLYCNELAIQEYNKLYSKFNLKENLINHFNTTIKSEKNPNFRKFFENNFAKNSRDNQTIRSVERPFFIPFKNNGTNACFANVAVQTILACGKNFFDVVN